MLGDFSGFNTVADRMQQGFLNMLFLGRAMIHPDGLAADPASRTNGQRVLDTERLFYDGNSQGGIMGGALTAVAPDFDRAVLGVPGMNYSTLLQRSVDFDDVRGDHLPELSASRSIASCWLSLIQLLWDRGEANGYAHHMTGDPLPDTPAHKVLMHVAFGDHQVSNATAEVEARTIGARCVSAGARPGALALAAPSDDPVDRELPVRRLGHRVLGHRAGQNRRRGHRGHGRAAADEHAEPDRGRPARRTRAPRRARARRSPSS